MRGLTKPPPAGTRAALRGPVSAPERPAQSRPGGQTARPGGDLAAFGARALSQRELVRLLLPRCEPAIVDQADRALGLVGAAREAMLLDLPHGARLLAALELGRRAWHLPSPRGRRVFGPLDVAAAVGPRASADETWVLGLDARLTLARLVPCGDEPGDLLRAALHGGAVRLAVAVRRPAPAVATSADCERAHALAAVATACRTPLLDWVVLGDDGFCSLVRLGLMVSGDRRYR